MKKIFWFAACCLLTTGFTACNDDDDENGNGNGTETPGTTPPNVTTDLGIQFPVAGTGESIFQYTDGKLTGGQTDYGLNCIISQNPLTIKTTQTYSRPEERTEGIYNNIKVNNSGFITSANYTCTETYGNITETTQGNATAQYDTEGHITAKNVNLNYEGGTWTINITYTWVDGNLTRIHVEDQSTEEGETSLTTRTYEYTYDEDHTKYLNTGIYFDEMPYVTNEIIWYAGLLGKTTRNIPTSMRNIFVEDGIEQYNVYYTIIPSYNEDKSVATLEYYAHDSDYPYKTLHYYYENSKALAPSTMQKGENTKSIHAQLRARRGKPAE